jgi:hypothetical protein
LAAVEESMSDDTPTQNLGQAGGDAPTERLAQTPADGSAPAVNGRNASSRRTIIILSSIGGALLLAALILLIVLFTRPTSSTGPTPTATTASPSATSTQSATPTPEPSETDEGAPPPAPAGTRFTNFIAPATEGGCSPGGPGFPPTIPRVKVAWTSAGADEAWYVNGTSDAANSGFMQIPLSGNQDDFPYTQDFNCSNDVNTYTITLVGPGGEHKSKTWHVENTGDTF